jgi:hypothetical protein
VAAANNAGNFVNEFPKWRKTVFENLVTAHTQPYNLATKLARFLSAPAPSA